MSVNYMPTCKLEACVEQEQPESADDKRIELFHQQHPPLSNVKSTFQQSKYALLSL